MTVDLGVKKKERKKMCVSPSLLYPKGHFYPSSEAILVPCRKCWQCRQAAVHMWTGRNLAEAATSTVSYAVTLTYGRSWDGRSDHVQSVQLMYQDMQKFLKRLRKRGYRVRYTIGGEYGADLGRAHWHGVFHFDGASPPEWAGQHLNWSQEQWDKVGGIHIPEWAIYGEPLGFVHISKASYAHVAYALKYLMKDQIDPNKHTVFHMSRMPPLGYQYFMELARETAQAALPIHDLGYKFDVITRSGEPKRMDFLLKGRLVELYLEQYIIAWKEYNPSRPVPETDLLNMWQEFGRVGNEDMLTATRVEEGEKDHRYNAKYGDERPKTLAEWRVKRDKQYRQKRLAERIKERNNDPAHRLKQWKLKLSTQRAERSAACAVVGISEQAFTKCTPAWQRFILKYPIDAKSLLRYKDGAIPERPRGA